MRQYEIISRQASMLSMSFCQEREITTIWTCYKWPRCDDLARRSTLTRKRGRKIWEDNIKASVVVREWLETISDGGRLLPMLAMVPLRSPWFQDTGDDGEIVLGTSHVPFGLPSLLVVETGNKYHVYYLIREVHCYSLLLRCCLNTSWN